MCLCLHRMDRDKLLHRIRSVPQGKVLDVSNMNPDGSGIKLILIPGPRSMKFGIDDPNIPFVSNNIESYEAVILMAYGEQYRWAINQMRTILNNANRSSSRASSPRASSPRASRR